MQPEIILTNLNKGKKKQEILPEHALKFLQRVPFFQ